MRQEPIKFLDALRLLVAHDVEFMVVGGVGAILEGAPISTFDLDILIRPSPGNLERLLPALTELGSRYLDPAGRTIIPDAGKLSSMKLHRLVTKAGQLDVLTEIGSGKKFEDLSHRMRLHRVEDFEVQVLELAAIIESKAEAGRDKDKATLGILRRALHLRQEPQDDS